MVEVSVPVGSDGVVAAHQASGPKLAPTYVSAASVEGPTNTATLASIAAYTAAGDRLRGAADLVYKVCIAVLVLIPIAWALGLLPAAARLF